MFFFFYRLIICSQRTWLEGTKKGQCCWWQTMSRLQMPFIKIQILMVMAELRVGWICTVLHSDVYIQAFSQNLKSGHPKCAKYAIGPAQISSLYGNIIMKNKTIFCRKWLSRGCLDTHLAKSQGSTQQVAGAEHSSLKVHNFFPLLFLLKCLSLGFHCRCTIWTQKSQDRSSI